MGKLFLAALALGGVLVMAAGPSELARRWETVWREGASTGAVGAGSDWDDARF